MSNRDIVNKAIGYILNHITEDIRVNDVARYCNFSRHHFSRMFKSVTSESLYGFIKRLKMEQSAFRLKTCPSLSITDVSQDYGYSSSNFSSAFTKYHSISPVLFRNKPQGSVMYHPFFQDISFDLENFESLASNITIENFPDIRVIYERKIGSYQQLSDDWDSFLTSYAPYITQDTLFLERTYSDPSITDVNSCIYDICLSIADDCNLPNVDIIKGGRFAVYHFSGHVSKIYFTFQSLFNIFFPRSSYTFDKRYSFDIYRKIDCNLMHMDIDFCIPIK